jgi:hypothetical protein
MDWVGIILLSMMMGMLWLNSALAAAGNALAQPDAPGVLSDDGECAGVTSPEGVAFI